MNEGIAIERRLLTVVEVAAYLGLSAHTLYTMVSQRRVPFPFIKVGRLTKFDRKEIDRWLDRNSVKPLACRCG